MSTNLKQSAVSELRATIDPDCYQAICDAFDDERPALVDALPALGKSRGLILWAAETGNPLTIYTLRHDLYRQFESACEEIGLSHIRVPSQLADCPLGKHYERTHGKPPHDETETWETELENARSRYGSSIAVHRALGSRLPCQADSPCPFVQAHDELHETLADDLSNGGPPTYDVIIGNFLHSNTTFRTEHPYPTGCPGLYTADRYVAFDEFPDGAIQEFNGDDFRKSVSAYLTTDTELPFSSYAELADNKGLPELRGELEEWVNRQAPSTEFNPALVEEGPDISALGSVLTAIEIMWKPLANGYSRSEVRDEYVAGMDDDRSKVKLLRKPQTQTARGVVALDGTPTLPMWETIIPGIVSYEVLPDDEQKQEHLRDTLGLRIIQTTTKIKPYAKAADFGPTALGEEGQSEPPAFKDILAFRWMVQNEDADDLPGLITTKRVLRAYEAAGLDFVSKTQHYQNLIGTNEFEETRFGIVSGCNYIGDDVVKMWAALRGHSVEAATNDEGDRFAGNKLTFGEVGDRYLHAIRENDVLQAVMRFGRKEVDGQKGATVYVHTSALPDWVQRERQFPRVHLWEDWYAGTQVIETLRDDSETLGDEWQAEDLFKLIQDRYEEDKSIDTIKDHLNEFMDNGILNGKRPTGKGAGRGRPYWYSLVSLDGVIADSNGYVLSPWSE